MKHETNRILIVNLFLDKEKKLFLEHNSRQKNDMLDFKLATELNYCGQSKSPFPYFAPKEIIILKNISDGLDFYLIKRDDVRRKYEFMKLNLYVLIKF